MNRSVFFRPILSFGLFSLLIACLSTCSPNPEPQPADAVKNFYEKLFQIVEQNSINRRKIDWTAYRATVWAKVGSAKTVPETEQAMVLAMALLKDNHSSVVVDNKRALYGGVGCGDMPTITAPTLNNIGYVIVTGFSGNELEGKQFAQAIQAKISQQDAPAIKGWIIDLRQNNGGNMVPMIGGLGPLIGEGICGFFYDVDDKPVASYQYQQGVVSVRDSTYATVDRPYQLINDKAKIAVLIGHKTASSGEFTAVAFIGKSNVRLFGTASCGLSTANTRYDLPFYGYTLNLFTSNVADRTGKVYGKEIKPDELAADDQIVDKATKWIMQ